MKNKLVQVYVCDGSALYLHGEMICDNFTCEIGNVLKALGHKWDSVRADDKCYQTEPFPKLLSQVERHKQ